MLDHTGIVVSDLKAARRFYDAVAEALGLQTRTLHPEFFVLGKSQEEAIPYLWIGTLIPSYWVEGSRPGINQMHVAFSAESKAMVQAFYEAALKAGGRDNGAPGPREGADQYYGAFVLDPDGNNIEAAYRGPDATD
ncbi:VOC family protein [Brevundimonas lenta]|uniref:Catechol 2,3-dioxygenase-like lactoylglutathione lyase family enzyme n=1 Tax=Brevundimonas lenta TaxID=424796 RepID=A0A7W6JA00_9CAUL|nr:VOC family protein [Brevundimonas lenta]MBB4081276.1 catechol 2,3-dioxygenase-like lactoylglutathione lyase family enzyme [Brevundimonas lenta]